MSAPALRRASWNLVDQVISSGTNAALSFLIARSVSSADFGGFAVAFTVFSLVIGVSRAVSTSPLSVRFTRVQPGEFREAAAAGVGTAFTLGIVSGLGCLVAGLVVGGAVSADGQRLALRTYTDAYVWPLTGSDVVGALSGSPVRVPLPDSPQGEAIAFASNDRDLLVSGEGLPAAVTLLPAAGTLAPAAATAPVAGDTAAPAELAHSMSPLTAGLIAAVVATALVWIAGKVRRRRE